MSRNIAPHIAGQAASSLDELAARVCKAQAGFVSSACNAVMHAIDAGQALIAAKELTLHGQWGKFLQRCDIGERQALIRKPSPRRCTVKLRDLLSDEPRTAA